MQEQCWEEMRGSVDGTPCSAGRKSFIYISPSLNCHPSLEVLLRLWGLTGKSEKEEIQYNFSHGEELSHLSCTEPTTAAPPPAGSCSRRTFLLRRVVNTPTCTFLSL